jgi:hypothetical protein
MTRERHPLRHSYFSVTACIIVAAIAMLAGHLFRVQSPQGLTPFLSANDRSRWATVRALLEQGTYSLDEVSFTTPLPEDTGGPQPPRAKRDPEWHWPPPSPAFAGSWNWRPARDSRITPSMSAG